MNNGFLRINNQDFSFEEIAKALAVAPLPDSTLIQVQLCQRVDSGVLTAGIYDYGGDYPGIDVELQLPREMETNPIMISRTEQPQAGGEAHNVRTFCYSRQDQYFMYFDADTRPDREVDEHTFPPSVTVSGDPGFAVDVWSENQYVHYKGQLPSQFQKAQRTLMSMEDKVNYYRSNIAEQITVLIDGDYLTADLRPYLEAHLDDITRQYVTQCDAWEQKNGRTVPLDIDLEFMQKVIEDAARNMPVKSLDAQISGAKSRAESVGNLTKEQPARDTFR